VFLAVAPKSNAVYVAFGEAKEDVERFGTLDVPARFRNAPTKLMKELGHGSGYRYAHDEPGAFVPGERYLPDEMPDRRYYRPVPRGLEIKIGEALARMRAGPGAAAGPGATAARGTASLPPGGDVRRAEPSPPAGGETRRVEASPPARGAPGGVAAPTGGTRDDADSK
jgi:MgsA-like AAA+ ATPase family protein